MNIENTPSTPTAGDVASVDGLLLELADIGAANYDALLEFHDAAPEDITRAAELGFVELIEADEERGVTLTEAGAAHLARTYRVVITD